MIATQPYGIDMNLKKEEREELNGYLSKMDIPSRRKVVDANGSNYQWLRKNLRKQNELPRRVEELLCLI